MDEPVGIQPQGHPPRVGERALVHESLDLDQEGPGPLTGHHDHAPWDRRFVARQEDGGRILDLPQPLVRHREDTQLVDRAEAVLDGPHQAEGPASLPLEVEDRVDHVLQDPRPGQTPRPW